MRFEITFALSEHKASTRAMNLKNVYKTYYFWQ